MFHDNAALAYVLVEPFLHPGRGAVPRFFERHDYVDVFRFIALKAAVLAQPRVRRVQAVLFIGNFFVVC